MAQSHPIWFLWAQLLLRGVSVILLFVSLGYVIYCSAKYREHLVAGYVVDLVLLVFNLSVLVRVCTVIFGFSSRIRRFEVGWISFADVVGILMSIFGGIFLLWAYGQNRECGGTADCDALRSYPASPFRNMATFLLFTVAGVTFFSAIGDFIYCCGWRKHRSS